MNTVSRNTPMARVTKLRSTTKLAALASYAQDVGGGGPPLRFARRHRRLERTRRGRRPGQKVQKSLMVAGPLVAAAPGFGLHTRLLLGGFSNGNYFGSVPVREETGLPGGAGRRGQLVFLDFISGRIELGGKRCVVDGR